MDVLLFGFVLAVGALQPAENNRRPNGEFAQHEERLVRSGNRTFCLTLAYTGYACRGGTHYDLPD